MKIQKNLLKVLSNVLIVGSSSMILTSIVVFYFLHYFPCLFFICFQAASFGKAYADDYNPDGFVDVCQALRVLNQVRSPILGMPLTFTQYDLGIIRWGCNMDFGGFPDFHLGSISKQCFLQIYEVVSRCLNKSSYP